LYDSIIAPMKTRVERSPLQDVLMMVGVVTVVAFAVGMMILLVGIYVMRVLDSEREATM